MTSMPLRGLGLRTISSLLLNKADEADAGDRSQEQKEVKHI